MSELTAAVFDCNIFVQALAAPRGPAGRCVQLALYGRIRLFVSPRVLAEVRDVLTRPNVIAKLRLRPDRVEMFIEAVAGAAAMLEGFPETFAYERDPDDAHYVNLALAAGARLIVSRDHDLLDLMDPATPDGARFHSAFPSLRIVDPVAFLQEVAPAWL